LLQNAFFLLCSHSFHVPRIRQKRASTMKLCRTRHIGTDT
jgi:hypothetical protein